jgi:hypothetical protein
MRWSSFTDIPLPSAHFRLKTLKIMQFISVGLWRSRFIFNLNKLIPCKAPYFRFRLLQLN